MLKIVYISDILSIHDFRFLKKLTEGLYDVSLITFYAGKETPENISSLPGLKIYHFPERIFDSSNDPFYSKITKAFLRNLFFCLQIIKYRKLLAEIKPDLVHAGWVSTSGFITALSNFKPYLLMPWGSDVLLISSKRNGMFGFFKRIVETFKVKYAIKRAAMIYCDCEEMKKRVIQLTDYPEGKIVVFPQLGIDVKRFQFQPGAKNKLFEKYGWDNKKILLLTRLGDPVYGIDYFLNALAEIVKIDPEARAVIAGEGKLKEAQMAMAKKMGLGSYVLFPGHIPNEELPLYYSAADLYVSSSLSDGTSLSLLEAMACGLPVVMTDVPANLEWIEDGKGGHIVPRKNAKELAHKIILLLKNNSLQKRMGEFNLFLAREKADLEKNFLRLKDAYSSCLRNKKN